MIISSKFIYLIVAILLFLIGPFLYWAYDKRVHHTTNTIKETYLEIWSYFLIVFTIFTKVFWVSSLKEKGKFLLALLAVGGISCFLVFITKEIIDFIPPYVIVVHDDEKGGVDYDEYLCIGTYKFEDGSVINGKIGETDIVNHSSFNLKYYSVHYVQQGDKPPYPATYTTIPPNEHIKVSDYPDYWFENPPSSKNSIWKSEVSWVIDVEKEPVQKNDPIQLINGITIDPAY